jgi:D-cysteine desulfhydrase family pyridoxal phosphate-dependent enzyme
VAFQSESTTTATLREAIDQKPRLPLAQLPTPLQEAPRLSERLGIHVLIKRDDQTGLALGGNKARKLEFLIADALARNADSIVTTGGSQSNHARITAAACRLAGLDCHLVLDRGVHPEQQGNLLLDQLLGAQVQFVETQDPAEAITGMETLAADLRSQGHTPYIIPRGGSVPAGATGYVNFVPELMEQLEQMEIEPTWLYLATGSTGTHSGVLAGLTAVGNPFGLQGISVSRDQRQQEEKVLSLANQTLQHLNLPMRATPEHVRVDDRYVGRGYGHPTEQTMEALEVAALDEGIILDPVYTGKAIAGLIGHARDGILRSNDTVVFVHTGGSPALFAYNREVTAALQSEQV